MCPETLPFEPICHTSVFDECYMRLTLKMKKPNKNGCFCANILTSHSSHSIQFTGGHPREK